MATCQTLYYHLKLPTSLTEFATRLLAYIYITYKLFLVKLASLSYWRAEMSVYPALTMCWANCQLPTIC